MKVFWRSSAKLCHEPSSFAHKDSAPILFAPFPEGQPLTPSLLCVYAGVHLHQQIPQPVYQGGVRGGWLQGEGGQLRESLPQGHTLQPIAMPEGSTRASIPEARATVLAKAMQATGRPGVWCSSHECHAMHGQDMVQKRPGDHHG